MPYSLSKSVDNLAEELNQNKCKDYINNCLKCIEDSCKTKYRDCNCCLEYVEAKNKILKYKCLKCNKNYGKECNENETKRF